MRLSILAMVAFLVTACGSGLSEEDAAVRCDQEQAAKEQCFDDDTYQACMDCYQECGDDCAPAATCPSTYSCPSE